MCKYWSALRHHQSRERSWKVFHGSTVKFLVLALTQKGNWFCFFKAFLWFSRHDSRFLYFAPVTVCDVLQGSIRHHDHWMSCLLSNIHGDSLHQTKEPSSSRPWSLPNKQTLVESIFSLGLCFGSNSYWWLGDLRLLPRDDNVLYKVTHPFLYTKISDTLDIFHFGLEVSFGFLTVFLLTLNLTLSWPVTFHAE